MMSTTRAGFKTTLQLYRDCLRLATHIGGRSPKGEALKATIGIEFRKHKDETDEIAIDNYKMAAVRGLSNYLLHESSGKNNRLKLRMDDQRIAAQEHLKNFQKTSTS